MNRNSLTTAVIAGLAGVAGIAHFADLKIFNETVTIDDLNNKLIELSESAKNIQARADAENRQLTGDEQKDVAGIFEAFNDTEAEIDRRKVIMEMEAKLTESKGRKSDPPNPNPDPQNNGGASTRAQMQARSQSRTPRIEALEDRNKWGFRSSGEYFMAVKNASRHGATPDPRLIANAAPGSYGSEGVGADGGFAVPPDFRANIVQKIFGEDSLLGSTDQQQSSSNSITFPVDETTPWQSTGGIQAFWESEGGLKQTSKPQLGENAVKLNKIIALVPLTDELLEDAPAMASYVNRKAPEKINWKINDAILNGIGVGQPLGILNSPGTIVVPETSGQVADTFSFANALALYTSVTASARRNAKWYMNQDLEQQLVGMSFKDNTNTPVPVYLAAGSVAGQQFSTLFGRPIVFTEAAQAMGDKGDVVFGDLQNYLSVTKTGGIKTDVSIHLYFDYDMTAFRFVLRVGGKPWWNSPIQPAHPGSRVRGFFATLATRA